MEITYTYCETCGRTEGYTDKCPRCGRRPGAYVCERCFKPMMPGVLCTTPACIAHQERIEVMRAFLAEQFGEAQAKIGVPLDDVLRATVQEVVRLRHQIAALQEASR